MAKKAALENRKLSLYRLGDGKIACISKGKGRFQAEAASYCIEKQGHPLSSKLRVVGDYSTAFELRRMPVTEQMHRGFKDSIEATEFGAEGVAISLVPELTDYQVVERMVSPSGCDYWLADAEDDDLGLSGRLEISGTMSGGDSERRKRVREKLIQTNRSDHTRIPALVVVVEFGDLIAEVVNKP